MPPELYQEAILGKEDQLVKKPDNFPSDVKIQRRALVAHARNPSYSGGRDQEDRGSRPAQGK
jgi:hypothetical protein